MGIPTALSVSFLLYSVYQAMGSLDWKECEYCEYWVFHPYLLDPDGMALCPWCWDFILEDGGIAMGSLEWKECQYCEYWDLHPSLLDDAGALCAWCWDFDLGGGIAESYEHWWCYKQCRPRRERYLQNFRVLPVSLRSGTIAQAIAQF